MKSMTENFSNDLMPHNFKVSNSLQTHLSREGSMHPRTNRAYSKVNKTMQLV